ncbi:MAG: L-lactate dehydrogenase [Butyricicoccaceae bacterium]
MISYQKCGIVGCGSVGAASAYTLAINGLFSELVLIDINREKAHGEAMDISHGISFARPCRVYAGDYADLADCGLVIIAAGVGQKPGESRLDLLRRNAAVMKTVIGSITAVNQECILLVVSNPVDLLTYMTLKISGFPPARVIGTGTVLDTARLKYLLGQRLHVDSRNVHAFIIGEHGDSELAVWSSANISGVDLNDYCGLTGSCGTECLKDIYENVRSSAYSIIDAKGATYYGIAMSVERIAECIVRDEHSVLPVSSLISGHYGVDQICLSLPCVVGRSGVQTVLDIPLDETEHRQLSKSAATLSELLNQLEL